jgi:acetylxylan esterase
MVPGRLAVMLPHRSSFSSLLAAAIALLAASPSLAATWRTNVSYGGTGPTMDLYVPDRVDASPGIVVALHYCGGSAAAAHGWFQALSDQHGFIIIAADSQANCWDASPGRTGEKAAVVAMVNYVIAQNNADRTKVFAAGASSGACLTNTLLGSYPDVFAAGSVLAGVPVGAWPAGNTSCSGVCNTTPPTRTAQAWGDIVRNIYSFSGTRPRVQLFHGSSDEYLYYPYLAEEVKQWTNVLGLSDANTTMESNRPSSGWQRTSYRDPSGTVRLEVNSKQGEVHDLTGKGLFPDVIRFFGLDVDSPTGTGGAGGGAGGRGGTTGSAGASGTSGGAGRGGTGGGAGRGGSGGSAGTTGAAGATGVAGTSGAAGTTGAGGATGAAGTTGTAGTTGGAGSTGAGGAIGSAGTTGSAGTSGAAGTTGASGATGTGTGGSATGAAGGDGPGQADPAGCASCALGGRDIRDASTLMFTLLLAALSLQRRPRRR